MSDLKCTAKEEKILLEKTKHDGKVAPVACGCGCSGSGEQAQKEADSIADATHDTKNPPTTK